MSLLAPVKPYFKYSMDMRTSSPIIAYYCQLYAVQKGLEIVKNDKSGQDTKPFKTFLMNEMQTLENMKKGLPEGTNKDDHRYPIENFVTSIFTNADKDERTCETITKKNAQDFNICSHFIMLLSLFGDAYDEGNWEEKRKYCMFKAGVIMKALKNGEQPERGNPNDPENNGQREIPKSNSHIENQEEQKQSTQNLPNQPPKIPDMEEMMNQFDQFSGFGGQTLQPPSQPQIYQPNSNQYFNQPNYNQFVQPTQNYQPSYQPQFEGQIQQNKAQIRGPQYYIDKTEIQKLIKQGSSEIDFNNMHNAIEFIKKAADICSQYGSGQQYVFGEYQAKPKTPASQQKTADLNMAKKLCKDAISEVDFSNIDGCIRALYQIQIIVQKY